MRIPKVPSIKPSVVIIVLTIVSIIVIAGLLLKIFLTQKENQILSNKYSSSQKDLEAFKKQDQVMINQVLKAQINDIQDTFSKSAKIYESLIDLKILEPKLDRSYDTLFALIINQLSELNYATATANLADLNSKIKAENDKIVALNTPISVPNQSITATASNAPPSNGYSRQSVHTNSGDFVVDIATADLGSAKVIVDTASDSTCANNCPVMSLADYVARSGAFAGVNGSYFCPADYPSCAGKTNSFDLLVMNKNKVYFNSDNNVYSTNPAAIFGNGYVRFVGQAQQWGRDTSVDGVISNFPLLVSGHNNVAGSSSDAKITSKSNRGFVSNIGNKVFIGVVHNASVAESATTLAALGMENALNLDSGGSTAFWFGGYKVGPGRNLPNVVLFVRK